MKTKLGKLIVFASIAALSGSAPFASYKFNTGAFAQTTTPGEASYYLFDYCVCDGCGSPEEPNKGGKCTGTGNCLSKVETCS
ncbi:hypothetical protein [Arsenicibacter rosenii]|uniref:hypothetical protein n=1 Tax=Arsenicibacter rosenii TaxID=1750698 RepID=UPI001160C53D|nr:hypothetical protein [Arsenicibacter rosenii]